MNDTAPPRLSSPTTLRDGFTILDIEHYAPFLLNAISAAWQRKTSAIYRAEFGFGITDWRVMAMLNIEPDISANRICAVVRLDKAAVSRSLATLEQRGLVSFEASQSDPRKRRWRLCDSGQQIHDKIMAIALQCEAEMMVGVTPDELDAFLATLRRILKNIDP